MIATVFTQPLIVAKVGLQSRPPPARQGKPFKSFIEVMQYIIEHEGVLGLFKGIAPQIMKGFLVQGLLMMTKEKIELGFILLLLNLRRLREGRLRKAREVAAKVADSARTSLIKTSD
ncbi:ADP/ATP carrier protein [Ascosphaera acerosa]|nr:ADP/ATP carrier protein [Ascosphaera acerosa]